MKEIRLHGSQIIKVDVDPEEAIDKIENMYFHGDWVEEKDGKYILKEEVGAGQHSFDREIKEVSKEDYELYNAIRTIKRKIFNDKVSEGQ